MALSPFGVGTRTDCTPSRKSQELVDLITTSRTVLSSFAKAKTAKLGRLSWRVIVLPATNRAARSPPTT
jgi:hypothetical protein